MTLKEIWNKYKTKEIAIYEGKKTVYPDFADEMLETHGNMEVKQYGIKDDILIVVF